MTERADYLLSTLGVPLGLVACLMLMQHAPAAIDTLVRALDTAPPVPSRPAPLVWAGLYLDRVFAGGAGGYIHMLRTARGETTIRTWAQQVAAGALMGNYLPTVVAHLVPGIEAVPDAAIIGMSFALGYAGFAVLSLFERRAGGDGAPRGDGPLSP